MKLIIELDGGRHAGQAAYDNERTRVLEANGYRVIRYWNDDVLLRTDDVLDDIHRALKLAGDSKIKGTPPQPSPSLREREGAKSDSA